MARERRTRTVEIQAGITVKLPRGTRVTAQMLAQALRHRIQNDVDPEGVTINFLVWRRGGKEFSYKGDQLDGTEGALARAARMIPVSRWVFRSVRGS